MDFFTHGLISFLFGQNLGFNYAIFAVWMGMFPDFDVVLIPFANKYNNLTLYHRGGIHSLFVLGIANLIGAFIINAIFPGNILLYFGIGFFCSGMHLFCDILTTFSIRPFWPFNKKAFKWDVTEAVNVLGACFSLGVSVLFYYTYYISLSPYFSLYVIIISGIIIGFLLFQLVAKLYLSHKLKFLGSFQTIPTLTPITWKVVQKQTNNQEINVRYAEYNIFSRDEPNFREFKFSSVAPNPPLNSDAEAVSFSYNLHEVQKHLWRVHNPLYCVEAQENSWIIYWFSAEMYYSNWTFAMQVVLEPSGNYSTKGKLFRVKKCRTL